jgi:hypothetical protein
VDEQRFEELAHRAGAQLRQPAPDDGVALLRRARRRRTAALGVAGVTVIALAAGSVAFALRDGPARVTDVTDVTTGTTTEPRGSTTTATSTTLMPTTPAPSSTAAATTSSPSTSTPPTTAIEPAGWVDTDPASIDAPTEPRCCASNWQVDEASPALPTGGSTLADGIYPAFDELSNGADGSLDLTVNRFERCDVLQPGACDDPGPDDYGTDDASEFVLPVPLDENLGVTIVGYERRTEPNVVWARPTATADGVALAEFLERLSTAYDTHVAVRLAAGATTESVTADFAANPRGGFEAEGVSSLIYRDPFAPPVLLQDLDPTYAPTDYLGILALEVRGGRPTIVIYAGFYS